MAKLEDIEKAIANELVTTIGKAVARPALRFACLYIATREGVNRHPVMKAGYSIPAVRLAKAFETFVLSGEVVAYRDWKSTEDKVLDNGPQDQPSENGES